MGLFLTKIAHFPTYRTEIFCHKKQFCAIVFESWETKKLAWWFFMTMQERRRLVFSFASVKDQNYRNISKIAKWCLKNETTIKEKEPSFFSYCHEEQPCQICFPTPKTMAQSFEAKTFRLSRAPARLCRFSLNVWVKK